MKSKIHSISDLMLSPYVVHYRYHGLKNVLIALFNNVWHVKSFTLMSVEMFDHLKWQSGAYGMQKMMQGLIDPFWYRVFFLFIWEFFTENCSFGKKSFNKHGSMQVCKKQKLFVQFSWFLFEYYTYYHYINVLTIITLSRIIRYFDWYILGFLTQHSYKFSILSFLTQYDTCSYLGILKLDFGEKSQFSIGNGPFYSTCMQGILCPVMS